MRSFVWIARAVPHFRWIGVRLQLPLRKVAYCISMDVIRLRRSCDGLVQGDLLRCRWIGIRLHASCRCHGTRRLSCGRPGVGYWKWLGRFGCYVYQVTINISIKLRSRLDLISIKLRSMGRPDSDQVAIEVGPDIDRVAIDETRSSWYSRSGWCCRL
jgi:hypothetical protein